MTDGTPSAQALLAETRLEQAVPLACVFPPLNASAGSAFACGNQRDLTPVSIAAPPHRDRRKLGHQLA